MVGWLLTGRRKYKWQCFAVMIAVRVFFALLRVVVVTVVVVIVSLAHSAIEIATIHTHRRRSGA